MTEKSPQQSAKLIAAVVGVPGLVIAFAWGLAEATLFFMVPDMIATLTALYSARRAYLQVALIVAGAVIGGALMFYWSSYSGMARNWVEQVPRIHEPMFA
jgi:hypothetical protein